MSDIPLIVENDIGLFKFDNADHYISAESTRSSGSDHAKGIKYRS